MRPKRELIASVAVCALGLMVSGTPALAKDKDKGKDRCEELAGPFTSVTGDPCDSPIDLCTHGLLEGDFEAQYDFTFETLDWAGDPTDPTKFVYTGTSVVTLLDGSGVIYTDDTGVIHIPEGNAPADFVTTATLADGTKDYKHAEGVFVATGTLVFETGQATGSYTAELCNAKHRKHCKKK